MSIGTSQRAPITVTLPSSAWSAVSQATRSASGMLSTVAASTSTVTSSQQLAAARISAA